jgi:hypothetical protein
MAIFDQENINKIFSCKFFLILGHHILDPDPQLEKMLDPVPESGSAIRKNAGSGSVSGSALNQCGSETLVYVLKKVRAFEEIWVLSQYLLSQASVERHIVDEVFKLLKKSEKLSQYLLSQAFVERHLFDENTFSS